MGDGEDPYYRKALRFSGTTGGINQSVATPAFSALNYSVVILSFRQLFSVTEDLTHPSGLIDVWTGSEWKNLVTQTKRVINTDGFYNDFVSTSINIPLEYVSSGMKFRFQVKGQGNAAWVIEDVLVSGTNYASEIQSESSITPDEKHLGPNATVYFYDPETKAILAKIKNLTAHDYGCTSVEIDRAGDGSSEWLNGFSISDKTLRVIPSNPNSSGKYEITLYYTAAELGEFASSITSMGKSEGGIGVGDASSSTAVPVTVSKYNDDFSFTAIFDTGFSGFGLSDAPPGTSLPVKLLTFEGKNTNEGNMLHWVTTEEVNNDYFAVQRSNDARKFIEISRVPALTVLSNSNNYYFTDNDFASGKSYYRLKQVDKDGKYAYSGIVVIQNEAKSNVIVYPNPTKGPIRFRIGEGGNGQVELKIVNTSGKTIQNVKAVRLENGSVEYDISGLTSGIYQAILSKDGKQYQYKIVRQ